MAKARPARKGSMSRSNDAGGLSQQASLATAGPTSPPLVPEEVMSEAANAAAVEPNEELQNLRSAVQLLAQQQAVQAQCVNLLMSKIKDEVQPDAAEQEVEFPPPKDPSDYHLRSGAAEGEQEASYGSEKPANADRDNSTVTNHPHSMASKSSKARTDKDSQNLQNSVAWKWRWAVEANKAKALAHRIDELDNGGAKVDRGDVRSGIPLKSNSTGNDDRAQGKGSTSRPFKLNLKALPAPIPSPTWMQSLSTQAFEKGDSASGTQLEGLQKQISQLTTCFNKMMPTLIFLVNRVGSQKLVNHCFAQWKALSSGMNGPELRRLNREDDTPSMKPCLRVLKGLGITQVKEPILQRCRVQRKASMTEFIQPKRLERMTPYASSTATTKALNTLQVSLHQELEELQGILASEVASLKRQVEARRPMHEPIRYGGCGDGLRWKHDLITVLEVANNVAQLLNTARCKLTSKGEVQQSVVQPGHQVPIPCRNRHRYACHPIISIAPSERPRGTTRSSSAAPIISITTPEPPQGTRPPPPSPIGRHGETIVHVSPTRTNAGCHVHITPRGSGRAATHVQAQEEWHGRQCLAAKHAAALQRQIERLKARHRSACARLQYHEEMYPRLQAPKTTLALLQHPFIDSQKSSSKETQTQS